MLIQSPLTVPRQVVVAEASEPSCIGEIKHFSWEKCCGFYKLGNASWRVLAQGGRRHRSETRKYRHFYLAWTFGYHRLLQNLDWTFSLLRKLVSVWEQTWFFIQILQTFFDECRGKKCPIRNIKFGRKIWIFAPRFRLALTVRARSCCGKADRFVSER